MSRILFLIIIFLFLIGIVITLFLASKKKDPLKTILMGIELTLVGGIIAADPQSSLGGVEYLLVLIGLALSITGYVRNTESQ